MPNRTVNDIFSQTGKLAIVTGLIGELANLAISQLLRWQQRKRCNEAVLSQFFALRTSRINNRFRGSWRWILYAMKSVYW